MDDLDATFQDLFGDSYPGSRHQRREDLKPAHSGDTVWDANPRIMALDGVDTEFFTIGALAEAVNREPVTIRSWERKGYLPKATYRSNGARQNRLYTRAQVEGIRRIAIAEGLMDPSIKKSPKQTQFVEKVQELFASLRGEK